MGVGPCVARGLLDPLIEGYRPAPLLAYLPLIVIWCGIGELSAKVADFLAMLAPIVLSATHGVTWSQPQLAARRPIRWRQPPSTAVAGGAATALPDIPTGLRIGLGAGSHPGGRRAGGVATRGLGFMVQSAAQFLVTDMVLAGIVVIGGIAFVAGAGPACAATALVPVRPAGLIPRNF